MRLISFALLLAVLVNVNAVHAADIPEGAGPEFIPKLLPLLEDDTPLEDKHWWSRKREAQSFIAKYPFEASAVADEWIEIAISETNPSQRRVAALRGLAAIGPFIREKALEIRPLWLDNGSALSDAAYETLVAVGHSSVAKVAFERCLADKSDPVFDSDVGCMSTMHHFGRDAYDIGPLVVPYLRSPDDSEDYNALKLLGIIGYKPAISEVEPFLDDPSWRMKIRAINVLAMMNARESAAAIKRATDGYWLIELERYGNIIADTLAENQPPYLVSFDNLLEPDLKCDREIWKHEGADVDFRSVMERRKKEVQLPFDGGALVGWDDREAGGLIWRDKNGKDTWIDDYNTIALFRSDDGVVSVHGAAFSHWGSAPGYASFVTRADDGQWHTEVIADFLSAPLAVKEVTPGKFLVLITMGRAFLFTVDGIQEELQCDIS